MRQKIILGLLSLLLLGCGNPPSTDIDISDSLFPLGYTISDSVPESEAKDSLPDYSPFVDITRIDSTIHTDIRYAGCNNFIGRPLRGYTHAVALLMPKAAQALAEANAELREKGMVLLVFDAYRPQEAVDDIMQWSHNTADTLMRQSYYPHLSKLQIRQQGYISKRSKHVLGYTVDLTLFDLATQQEVDMGSPFDLFDPISHYNTNKITPQQKAHRQLLRSTMTRHGFYPIECEWWHFTLRSSRQ